MAVLDSGRRGDKAHHRRNLRSSDGFGHVTVINPVGLLGYYALVAMTLNTFGMRAEGQTELPFREPRE